MSDKYAALNPGLEPTNKTLAKGCGSCDAGPEYAQVPSCSDDAAYSSVKPDSTTTAAN